MKAHVTTQFEMDDGSMTQPFMTVHVFKMPPRITVRCRSGIGLFHASDKCIYANPGDDVHFEINREDHNDPVHSFYMPDLSWELMSNTRSGFQYKAGIPSAGDIGFQAISEEGAKGNLVVFRFRITSRL